jgi:hypothetical protein
MLRDTCPDLAASNELWRVKLASGEQPMTLEEIDAAFETGRIDADTLVCPPGSLTFARLGAMAGLDAEEAPAAIDIDVELEQVDRLPRMPAMSLDLSADLAAFRPRWSTKRLLAVPAVLATIAIIIAFAAQASASSELPASLPVAAEIAAPRPIAAPVIATPPPAPAAPVLTEAQKKALSAKDKKAEAAKNAKRTAITPPRAPTRKSSAPFSKGGNKHDPLNGSL